jgi:hypothetical protein
MTQFERTEEVIRRKHLLEEAARISRAIANLADVCRWDNCEGIAKIREAAGAVDRVYAELQVPMATVDGKPLVKVEAEA